MKYFVFIKNVNFSCARNGLYLWAVTSLSLLVAWLLVISIFSQFHKTQITSHNSPIIIIITVLCLINHAVKLASSLIMVELADTGCVRTDDYLISLHVHLQCISNVWMLRAAYRFWQTKTLWITTLSHFDVTSRCCQILTWRHAVAAVPSRLLPRTRHGSS